MGTISIFDLEVSGLRFACARDFPGVYHLRAGDFVVTMTPETASALAFGGGRIRTRAQVASQLGREMNAGTVYRRDLLAIDGRVAHIEFGVTDGGAGLFLEVGTTRLALTDQQAELFLAVLDQLGRDVSAVYRATAVPEDMGFGIAPGLRGPGLELPDWADDTKWR
jgi:hypothetical protein